MSCEGKESWAQTVLTDDWSVWSWPRTRSRFPAPATLATSSQRRSSDSGGDAAVAPLALGLDAGGAGRRRSEEGGGGGIEASRAERAKELRRRMWLTRGGGFDSSGTDSDWSDEDRRESSDSSVAQPTTSRAPMLRALSSGPLPPLFPHRHPTDADNDSGAEMGMVLYSPSAVAMPGAIAPGENGATSRGGLFPVSPRTAVGAGSLFREPARSPPAGGDTVAVDLSGLSSVPRDEGLVGSGGEKDANDTNDGDRRSSEGSGPDEGKETRQRQRRRGVRRRRRRDRLFAIMPLYDIEESLPIPPPLIVDVFEQVLLFVPVESLHDLFAVAQVCRGWRFYASHMPQWTYWHFRRVNRHMTIGGAVLRVRPRRNPPAGAPTTLDGIHRFVKMRDSRIGFLRRIALKFVCLSHCFVTAIFVGGLYALVEVQWRIGDSDNGLTDDASVGTAAFFASFGFLLAAVVAACLYVAKAEGNVPWLSRVTGSALRGWILLCGFMIIALYLGPPLALLGGRARSAGQLVRAGAVSILDLASTKSCRQLVANATQAALVLTDEKFLSWQLAENHEVLPGFNRTGVLFGVPYTILEGRLPGVASYPNITCFGETGVVTLALLGVNATDVLLRRYGSRRSLPPSLRLVRPTSYFNTDDGSFYRRWYQASGNALVARRGAVLLRADAPETMEDMLERLRSLLASRTDVLIAVLAIASFFLFLSVAPRSAECLLLALSLCALCVNPIVVTAAGIVCTLDSRPSWAMCNTSSGVGLICAGAAAALIVLGAAIDFGCG